MRRILAQPQDSKSESARQERDIIAGDKTRLENEMISIAETNKRLRSEGRSEKDKLDKELEDKKFLMANEITSLNKFIEDKIIVNNKLETESKAYIANNIVLSNENSMLIIRNKDLLKTYDNYVDKIKYLEIEKLKYEKEISVHIGEIKILNEKNSSSQQSVFVFETKINEMIREVSLLDIKINEKQSILKVSDLNILEASKKLKQIVIDLSLKSEQLKDLNIEVIEVKQKATDCENEISKKSEEFNEKYKNFKLLEQRIDEKLELFERFKDKFSVDELAKMKLHSNIV